MITSVEHLFMYLLAICVSSLEKRPFWSKLLLRTHTADKSSPACADNGGAKPGLGTQGAGSRALATPVQWRARSQRAGHSSEGAPGGKSHAETVQHWGGDRGSTISWVQHWWGLWASLVTKSANVHSGDRACWGSPALLFSVIGYNSSKKTPPGAELLWGEGMMQAKFSLHCSVGPPSNPGVRGPWGFCDCSFGGQSLPRVILINL